MPIFHQVKHSMPIVYQTKQHDKKKMNLTFFPMYIIRIQPTNLLLYVRKIYKLAVASLASWSSLFQVVEKLRKLA